MSKSASELQYKVMSFTYRGKEIFKPLNTGWIDEGFGSHDPNAPYDGYDERDDTEASARSGFLPAVVPVVAAS